MNKEDINTIKKTLKQSQPPIPFICDELMANHTTFQTGGPADLYIAPTTVDQTQYILKSIKKINSIPFILGGGANILVADKGIRGLVIDTCKLTSITLDNKSGIAVVDAGAQISHLAETTVKQGFEGLENFHGMPGSVGGAIYMNARCYEKEIADILIWTDIINQSGEIERIHFSEEKWSYKKSPFQKNKVFILRAGFKIEPIKTVDLSKKMLFYKENRSEKGHFLYPCAGSTFKNNRAFGQPTGKIIDSLDLKGYSIGDAAVSDFHANIIINKGDATSDQIYRLIRDIQIQVKDKTGFELEPEVELIGEWD